MAIVAALAVNFTVVYPALMVALEGMLSNLLLLLSLSETVEVACWVSATVQVELPPE